MQIILSAFAVTLSVAVYPAILLVNSELIQTFSYIEVDFFNWWRFLLVSLNAVFLPLIRRTDYLLITYLTLLILSSVLSRFPETCMYGTPMHHEGAFALLGYVGLFLAVRRYGISPLLEKAFALSIYCVGVVAVLQLIYGNFLNFPLFKSALPDLSMTAMEWPIYSTMGSPNHLGLYTSFFLPWAIVKKKTVLAFVLIALLIGTQSRAAWLSACITTVIVSRRYLFLIIAAACLCFFIKSGSVLDRVRVTMHDIHYPVRDSDLDGRGYMWKRAVPLLKDSIFLGHGPATFMIYFPQFTERSQKVLEGLAVDRPHNMMINVWEGTGLLSLGVLATFILKILHRGKDFALKLSAIGFLITGLFTDSVLSVTPFFAMFLGGLEYEHNEKR